jgi:hypothetical protein
MQWTPERISSELASRFGRVEGDIFERIVAWAKERTLRPWCGKGKIDGSYYSIFDHDQRSHQLFAVWTDGRVVIQFGWMVGQPPFDAEQLRIELLERLNAVPGVSIARDRITTYPSFLITALADQNSLNLFLSAFDWFIEQVKVAPSTTNDA